MIIRPNENVRCPVCGSERADRTHEAMEPSPADLCWVGSYIASLDHTTPRPGEYRVTGDELAAIDRVSRWLCARGLAR